MTYSEQLTLDAFVTGFVDMTRIADDIVRSAIVAVEEHADEKWKLTCLDVIQAISFVRYTFTTDEVWEQLAHFDVSTHEPRAMGAMMRQAVKEGWCVPTDIYQKSSRVVCHTRPLRVWRSLLVNPLFEEA